MSTRIVFYTIPSMPDRELRYVVRNAQSDENAVKVVKRKKPYATIKRVVSST